MNERKILREIAHIFGVNESDLPKTLSRFKTEIEKMESELYGRTKHNV